MMPRKHIIIGAICALLIFLIFPQIGMINAAIIFLASVLIDVDHYLYYVYKKGDWNLKRAYIWFIAREKEWLAIPKNLRKEYKRSIFIFHGIEFWLALALLIWVHKIFLYILFGIIIHMLLDFIDIIQKKEILSSKIAQIPWAISNKNKLDLEEKKI